jgi:SAM-dependent methyltransferase
MLRVLKDMKTIHEARAELRKRGLDTTQGWRRFLFTRLWKLRYSKPPEPVSVIKSWDVLQMTDTILKYVPDKNALIYEMGSYNSEISLALWGSRYRNIRASDFNPLGHTIRWYWNRIDFRAENFYEPALEPGSCSAIVALSVIEHGYDRDQLVKTVDRLLKPGGVFCCSTDYHDPKIHVPDTFRAFDLSFLIFSRQDVQDLLDCFAKVGIEPIEPPEWGESENPIRWEGFQYSFVFFTLRKKL